MMINNNVNKQNQQYNQQGEINSTELPAMYF